LKENQSLNKFISIRRNVLKKIINNIYEMALFL
jgi:hypothetical protein